MIPKNCLGKELEEHFKSNRKNKKLQVCVKDNKGNIKNIHFGDKRYRHNYSKKANKNFRLRHGCDPVNKLKKDTAKFWACEKLWGDDKWE